MKKKIAVLTIILSLVITSVAFARGNSRGGHPGYHNFHFRPNYYGHRGGGHHNNGLGIAVGVVGGLLLGSALSYRPPPQTVVYGAPYPTYQPEVVVQQRRICMEERVFNGEWQISRYNGQQIWVPYQNPIIQRVQVPCF